MVAEDREKRLAAFRQVEMLPQRQAAIKELIAQASDADVENSVKGRTPRRIRRMLGPWMAGVAGLLVVAGGLYAASRTFALHQTAGSNPTGSGSVQTGRYSALGNVSPSMLATFKQEIQKAPIHNIMLPTNLPFTVTSAQEHNIGVLVQIVLSNPQHTLVVQLFAGSSLKGYTVPNEKSTSLSNGSPALFGFNDKFSDLGWSHRGVLYDLSSTNAQHKADLSETQLVSVADSFQ